MPKKLQPKIGYVLDIDTRLKQAKEKTLEALLLIEDIREDLKWMEKHK